MRIALLFTLLFLIHCSLSVAASDEEIRTFQKYSIGQRMSLIDSLKFKEYKPVTKLQGLFDQKVTLLWGGIKSLKPAIPGQFAYVSGSSTDESSTIYKTVKVSLKVGTAADSLKVKAIVPKKIQINYYYYGWTFDVFKLSVSKNVDIKLSATCENVRECNILAEKRYTAFTPFVSQYVEIVLTYPTGIVSFYADYLKG